MTRARIGEGLELLVLLLANGGDTTTTPVGWMPHEWSYLKGLASACVLFWRGRLLDEGTP